MGLDGAGRQLFSGSPRLLWLIDKEKARSKKAVLMAGPQRKLNKLINIKIHSLNFASRKLDQQQEQEEKQEQRQRQSSQLCLANNELHSFPFNLQFLLFQRAYKWSSVRQSEQRATSIATKGAYAASSTQTSLKVALEGA